jgi:hypothetical protein
MLNPVAPLKPQPLEVVPSASIEAWGAPAPTKARPASTLAATALLAAKLLACAALGAGIATLGFYLAGKLSLDPKKGTPAAPSALSAEAPMAKLPNSLTFISIGDWGRGGNAAQMAPVPAMAAWAETLDPEFVLSVGDNFYEGPTTAEGGDLAPWQWDEGFRKVYAQPSLVNRPWYVIQGNHGESWASCLPLGARSSRAHIIVHPLSSPHPPHPPSLTLRLHG